MTTTPFSLCVYCGSRPGKDPAFAEAADALGAGIAANGWRLVYGAGDVGLMGRVAAAATSAGAPTLGVIPEHLMQLEALKDGVVYGDRVVTETMHERKKVMFMNADAVVVLPGGAGSLDEFFEVLTWAQIELHRKPIFLLNVAGYWDPLIALIDHVIANAFAAASLRDLFQTADSVDALIHTLKNA